MSSLMREPDAPGSATPDWRAGALGELHGMLLSTVSVGDLLDAAVVRAAERLGAGTSASMLLRRGSPSRVVSATDERAAACDRAESDSGAGPCLRAIDEGRRITVSDIRATTEPEWEAWRRATHDAGFRASVALPAVVGDDLALALNVYRAQPGTWDEDALDEVSRFAEDAARAVALAVRVEDQVRVNEDLKQAMSSRAVIDQAIGIVMAQNRCDPARAFEILRSASQHRNQKLRDLAAEIVTKVAGAPPSTPNEFRERSPRP